MDETEYLHVFVNEFCNQLADHEKGMRDMHAFYLFADKRLGSLKERFDTDARAWGDYQNRMRGKP